MTSINRIWMGIAMLWVTGVCVAEDPVHLQPVVVTATRGERALDAVPARMNVLEHAQMTALPAVMVDDLLTSLAGINIQRNSGIFSLRPVVSLRGLGGDEQGRTLVLLDGVPVNTSDNGGVNWSRLGMEQIERIEVARGPGSALYGSQAMGGVINIITRQPVAPLEGELRLAYGSQETWDARFRAAGAQDPQQGGYWQVSGRYLESEGYNATPPEDRTEFTVDRFVELAAVSAKVGYRFAPDSLLEVAYDYFDDLYGEGEKIQAPDGATREYDTDFYRLRYRTPVAGWDLTADAFFQREQYLRVSESQRGSSYTRFDVESNRDDLGTSLHLSRPLADRHLVAVGAEIREGRVDAADVYKTSPDIVANEGKMRFYSFYLQNETTLDAAQTWSLLAALRYDYAAFFDGAYFATDPTWEVYNGDLDENEWDHVSPRVGVNYTPDPQWRLYASYGRGFRASILDDLCRSGWMWVGPKIANPELKPEKLDTVEFGLDWRSRDHRWTVAPTVFYSRGYDFLYYIDTGDKLWGTRAIWRRENVGEVEIAGLELEADYALTDHVTLFAAYTFTHSDILKFRERPELEGKELTYNPRNRVSAGIRLDHGAWGGSLDVRYKDRQFSDDANQAKIDAYVTADATAWYRPRTNLELRLTGQNLLDEAYLESATSMGPGAVYRVELARFF